MKRYAIIDVKIFDKDLHKYWGYKSKERHVRKSKNEKKIVIGVYSNAQKNALEKKEIAVHSREAIRKLLKNF